MMTATYKAQVDLLLSLIPHVATEKLLALKGGTAINLFVRDMPRLSVDIDLTYIPVTDDRPTALKNISQALERIEKLIRTNIDQVSITHVPAGQGQDVKLNCQLRQGHVKIEVNTVTRGVLFPVRLMQVHETVQKQFKKFAAINVVAHGDLFGGKICAALDRQHPRDIFDVKYLLDDGGVTDEVKRGFLLFLLSHARPFHELLSPHLQDQRQAFTSQFAGMTEEVFTYEEFERVRTQLVAVVNRSLTDTDKKFLLAFKKGKPDWDLIPIPELRQFPAVQWKLHNIRNLMQNNAEKHSQFLAALETILK